MAMVLGLKWVQTYKSPVVQHATVVHSSLGYKNVTSKQHPVHNVASEIINAWILVSGVFTARSLS